MTVKTFTVAAFGGALALYMTACTVYATAELFTWYQDARAYVAAYEAARGLE